MNTLWMHIQNSDLPESQKRKAISNIVRATADEVEILANIFDIPDRRKYVVGQILSGAHVRVWDKGARYDDWKSLPTAGVRGSSHAAEGKQYHVDGPLAHTILFGKFGGWTWLQLESHPIYDVVSFVGHMADYFKYRFGPNHNNQGPYGSSRHTEHRDSLWLHPTKAYTPIDRDSWMFKGSRSPRMPGRSPFR